MKKIELNILIFIIVEAIYLLLFFKTSFLNLILGILLGILLIIFTKKAKKNKVIEIFLFIISIPLFILILYKSIQFISDNLLKNYSIIPLYFALILTIFYLVKDYHTFIKSLEIIFYIIIFLKIIKLIFTIPLINFHNIIFNFNINYTFIIISFSILLMYNYLYYFNNYKITNKELLISFINPSIIKIMTILVIGNPLVNIYKYPYVNYLKKIKYLNFIERIDGLLSFEYLLSYITLLAFLLLIIKSKLKSQ